MVRKNKKETGYYKEQFSLITKIYISKHNLVNPLLSSLKFKTKQDGLGSSAHMLD